MSLNELSEIGWWSHSLSSLQEVHQGTVCSKWRIPYLLTHSIRRGPKRQGGMETGPYLQVAGESPPSLPHLLRCSTSMKF